MRLVRAAPLVFRSLFRSLFRSGAPAWPQWFPHAAVRLKFVKGGSLSEYFSNFVPL